MKGIITVLAIVVLLLSGTDLRSQVLFNDSLETKVWIISDTDFPDDFWSAKKIGLQLRTNPDAAMSDKSMIWRFAETLSISIYNSKTEMEEIIHECDYSITDSLRYPLEIKWTGDISSFYKIGITSTGTYAILSRKK